MADFLPFAEIFPGTIPSLDNVKCRDPDDQVFLELAIAAGADAVVTGDADLLALSGNTEVPILTPLSSVGVSSGNGDRLPRQTDPAAVGSRVPMYTPSNGG